MRRGYFLELGCHTARRGVALRTLRVFVLTMLCGVAHNAIAQQWLVDANQRIDQHRKANMTIQVVDSLGRVVPGANVHVEMKRHSFGFGTAVPASLINQNSTDANTFRQKLLENFNHVVFENDLKWPAWVGLWGSGFSWNNTQQALNWLDANELPARGHYASWATWSGSDAWGTSQNTSTLPTRLFDHIANKLTVVGNRVYEWDVINHPVGWLTDTYENRLPSGLAFYADIIDHARSVAPAGMPMWINEDDITSGGSADNYERIISYLIDNGSSPDGIGMQEHTIQAWGRIRTPEQVLAQLERFAELIPRLRVTEFDVDVGTDQQYQAQLMHDYLVTYFSHPAMEAVTLWGFWEGSHWRPNAALYSTNWTAKPALDAYQNLVLNEWWTDATSISDAAGEYHLRGFKGQYDITVTMNGQDFVMPGILFESDSSVLITVGLPGDFNSDGKVDAADYVVWRNNSGGNFTPNDYTVWRANFGRTAGSGANVAIPEPTTWMLLLIVAIGLSGQRQRRAMHATAQRRPMRALTESTVSRCPIL